MEKSGEKSVFKRMRLLTKDPAARRELKRALAEGPRLTLEALNAGLVHSLWATPEALGAPGLDALHAAIKRRGLPVHPLEEWQFKALADTRTPQGWLCEIETKAPAIAPDAGLYVALDAIQDPGNLGTLLRCAWASGAAVLLGPGCADVWSSKVLRSGAGAQFHTALRESGDLAAELRELRSRAIRIYATAPRAPENYLKADCRLPHCWVLGSEGRGLSEELQALCDDNFRISYPGCAESLNAAVSGAVLLFETLRQRA